MPAHHPIHPLTRAPRLLIGACVQPVAGHIAFQLICSAPPSLITAAAVAAGANNTISLADMDNAEGNFSA